MQPDVLASDLCFIVPDAELWHFGVLSSAVHVAWVRQICGRLKSDFRYSGKLVYNNYPWPEKTTGMQRAAVEAAARGCWMFARSFLKPRSLTSTTPWPCPPNSSELTLRWTAPSIGATANSRSPPIDNA
jgi:hypothetical protein